MPDIKVPIICGDRIGSDSDYYDAIPVNLIGALRDIDGETGYLYSHDGLSYYNSDIYGASRGALYNERMGRSFRFGSYAYEIFADDTTALLGGSIISGFGYVSTPYSFNSFLIVGGGSSIVYRYDGVNFSQMTDPDIGQPIDCTWIDGYYIFTDGEYLYHTDINDETSIDPLKFATSEISPDKTLAVGRTQDNLLVAFNRYSTEYFINQANEQFAFTRLNQKALSVGIIGTKCWVEMGGQLFILGGRKEEQPGLHAIGSGQAVSISTRTIDLILSGYTEEELSTSKLESRTTDGVQLLYVMLPSDTLIFNATIAKTLGVNSAWSRLESNGGRWIGVNIIYDPVLNSWACGSRDDGKNFKLLKNTASQANMPVDSYFYTPSVPAESFSIDELEINTVSGFNYNNVGLFVSTTSDLVSYSTEYSKELAIPLDYENRYIVRRLGYVRKRIAFKFRAHHSDKINVSGLTLRGS